MNNPGESIPHIWLRYATQYTKDGRQHTIEMGIPVPLGANEEVREALISEAEAGMQQLIDQVEQRVPQMMQRSQGSQGVVPTPIQPTKTAPQQRININNKPASLAAPPTTTQTVTSSQEREVGTETAGGRNNVNGTTPQTRPIVGVGMPQAFSPTNTNSGNLLLPEFIQYIKETLNLNPKQAMEILKVKSLSGINLRDALEQLRWATEQSASEEEQGGEHETATRPISYSIPPPRTETTITTERPQDRASHLAIASSEIQEGSTRYQGQGFDEEVDLEGPEQLEELPDLEAESEFTPEELGRARTKIDQLRESQGATTVSESRLKALSNVVISQVSLEQLQELVHWVWNIPSLKKLKVDQVEALISWGKEDEFMSEVEAVIAVLEEEHYARGNR